MTTALQIGTPFLLHTESVSFTLPSRVSPNPPRGNTVKFVFPWSVQRIPGRGYQQLSPCLWCVCSGLPPPQCFAESVCLGPSSAIPRQHTTSDGTPDICGVHLPVHGGKNSLIVNKIPDKSLDCEKKSRQFSSDRIFCEAILFAVPTAGILQAGAHSECLP